MPRIMPRSAPPIRQRLPRIGRAMWLFLALLLAAGAVGGPGRSLLPVYLEHDLAWPPLTIAMLVGARLLTAALSAPLGGALADAASPRRTLWLGLAGLPIAALAFFTPTPALLAALILVAGLADGLQSTGSQAYLVASAGRTTLGLATAAFYLGSTLGGALGNLVAGALLPGWGFAGLGAVSLAAGLLVVVSTALLPAGTPATPATPAQTDRATTLLSYRRLLDHGPVRWLALLRFLSTCFWGTATLLWPLLIARLGDPATAALFGTVSLVLAAACQLVTGRLVDAVGPARPARVLTTLLPLTALLSALALAAASLPALFAAGVLGTCVAWSLSGTLPPLIRAVAPADQRGALVGLLHLLWCLAMLAGTVLGGWLLPLTPSLPFWTAALLTLPTALAARRLRL